MARGTMTRMISAALGVGLAVSMCVLLPGIASGSGCVDGALLLACLSGSSSTMPGHGPPLAPIVLAAVGSLFVLAFAKAAVEHISVSQSLRSTSRSTALHGLDVELVEGIDGAVVAGLVRPRIYCSEALPLRLDDDELRAVLLHERHHQRALAPLQLVALAGVSPLLWWSEVGRGWVAAQQARIEIGADRHVLSTGIGRDVLARALVKLSPGAQPFGPGFATAADLRLRALLGDEFSTTVPTRAVPIAAAAFVAACALLGVL